MPDHRTAEHPSRDAWVRTHVMTRFFATVWWVVMVFITIWFAGSWIQFVVERSWRTIIPAAIVSLIFIPIWREWPNARRMGRMLRHGT